MDTQPLDVLKSAMEDVVTVRLKTGDVMTGVLAGYDEHMNLILESAYHGPRDEYGERDLPDNTTVIRGDNIVSITP